jgi:hypothetical protein
VVGGNRPDGFRDSRRATTASVEPAGLRQDKIVREHPFLALGRHIDHWLYQHRSTLTLEGPLQLDREEVELEKSSLTDGVLEIFGPVRMVSIIQIDGAELKIGPVFDASCGSQSSPFPS